MKKHFIILIALMFGYINTQAQVLHRKCGTTEYLTQQKAEDPGLELRMLNYEQALQKWIENNREYIKNSKTTVTVPVVVHILYNTTAENVSDTRVLEQINVLNSDYAGLNTHSMQAFDDSLKVNTNLQFCLAKRTPEGLATSGIERRYTPVTVFYIGTTMKYFSSGGLDAWDPAKYMNIWVCNLGGGYCGFAQYPSSVVSPTYGVVINYRYFGKTGAIAPYNLGGTTTHEIGHCFNLNHTWGDDAGACTGNDYAEDVPNEANYTSGTHTGVLLDACSPIAPGVQYTNFMDYSDDISYANFTPDQAARIAALFVPGGLLYSLSISDGCTPVDAASCGTPTGLSATAITQTAATLNWSAVSGATSYYVQYRMSGTTPFTTIVSSATSANISGLASATTYEFQVQALCVYPGEYSGLTTFTTLQEACVDNYESNNTVSAAKNIVVNSDINAMIGASTDIDYFKFKNTKKAKNINITLTDLPANFDLALYNNSGKTLLATSQNTGTNSESIIYNTTKKEATYVIKVYGVNAAYSATTCYTLTANISGSAFKIINEEIGENNTIGGISLYPNPANDKLTIEYNSDNAGDVVLRIYDVSGRSIATTKHQASEGLNTYSMDVAGLSKGMYILSLEINGTIQNEKLIIDK